MLGTGTAELRVPAWLRLSLQWLCTEQGTARHLEDLRTWSDPDTAGMGWLFLGSVIKGTFACTFRMCELKGKFHIKRGDEWAREGDMGRGEGLSLDITGTLDPVQSVIRLLFLTCCSVLVSGCDAGLAEIPYKEAEPPGHRGTDSRSTATSENPWGSEGHLDSARRVAETCFSSRPDPTAFSLI